MRRQWTAGLAAAMAAVLISSSAWAGCYVTSAGDHICDSSSRSTPVPANPPTQAAGSIPSTSKAATPSFTGDGGPIFMPTTDPSTSVQPGFVHFSPTPPDINLDECNLSFFKGNHYDATRACNGTQSGAMAQCAAQKRAAPPSFKISASEPLRAFRVSLAPGSSVGNKVGVRVRDSAGKVVYEDAGSEALVASFVFVDEADNPGLEGTSIGRVAVPLEVGQTYTVEGFLQGPVQAGKENDFRMTMNPMKTSETSCP